MGTNYEIKMENHILFSTDYVTDAEGFRHIYEDYIPYLRLRAKTKLVDKNKAYQFRHDLSAYLHDENIDFSRHWMIMRLNNMKYNWEFDESVDFLYIPEEDDIAVIAFSYSNLESNDYSS